MLRRLMSRAKQAVKGLRPRACQVPNKLANCMRTVEPSGLRVPPLILRATAKGRIRRSNTAWERLASRSK